MPTNKIENHDILTDELVYQMPKKTKYTSSDSDSDADEKLFKEFLLYKQQMKKKKHEKKKEIIIKSEPESESEHEIDEGNLEQVETEPKKSKVKNIDNIKSNINNDKKENEGYKCDKCDKILKTQKTLKCHKYTCGNVTERKIGDRPTVSLKMLKERGKELDEKFNKAEKMIKQGKETYEIINELGLNHLQVGNLRNGKLFSTYKMTDKEILEKVKKNKENLAENVNKDSNIYKINKRSYNIDVMWDILQNKGKMSQTAMTKKYKNKKGKPLSNDAVRRILNGESKMYPEDFEVLGITEEDYQALLKK